MFVRQPTENGSHGMVARLAVGSVRIGMCPAAMGKYHAVNAQDSTTHAWKRRLKLHSICVRVCGKV